MPVSGARGLLPNAAVREPSASTPPTIRRTDDKGRIYHPALAELDGWAAGTRCAVTVDGDYLQIRPASQTRGGLGRFDGARLRVPVAALQAIGVAPGHDVALLVDAQNATVTISAGPHLTDAFWAVGELEARRDQLSQLTAEPDAALADAKAAQNQVEVLTGLLAAMTVPDTTRPLVQVGR